MYQHRAAFVLVLGLAANIATCFMPHPRPSLLNRQLPLASTTVPSLEQLTSDPFMKQVSYAAVIASELTNDDFVEERLVAQLSHSDGIRGFFATYLTREGETAADNDIVPTALQNALKKQVNQDELISLACMNVVMPTATSSLHADPELAAASQKTAERGMRVLTVLLDNPIAKHNCAAIYAASSGKHANSDLDLVKYWSKFFRNYGYGDKQLEDIARVFGNFVPSSAMVVNDIETP